ncbi:MAG: hypothetical protein V7607_1283, partial [Solirubrobacteraceae bacterium]
MNFELTDDQRAIQRAARDFLADAYPPAEVRRLAYETERGFTDEGWAAICELAWPALLVPEEHGGLGLGVVELAVVQEELGAALAPSPFLSTVAAAALIADAGSDEQRARWLPGLASGETTGAIGGPEMVADGDGAAVIVLVEDGAARVLDAADADVEPFDSIDPTRRFARVRADGQPLGGDVPAAIDRAVAALSAELVGVSQRALDMTLAYVKDRKQFDTPVGAFQAVGHRCAQMLLHTEGARSAAYFAAWAADAAPERLSEAASLAKAAGSESGREVTASAIQAHGGIGFTWEADVHWLYKRAQL